jgi:hypothetical protein
MNKYLPFVLFLILAAYIVPAYAANPGEGSVYVLLSQTANVVVFDKSTMTLK